MDLLIENAWLERKRMYTEVTRLRDAGDMAFDQGNKKCHQGDELTLTADKKRNTLLGAGQNRSAAILKQLTVFNQELATSHLVYAEGSHLIAEGSRLRGEGSKQAAAADIVLLDAIISVYGNDIGIMQRYYDGETPWVLEGDIIVGKFDTVIEPMKYLDNARL